MKTLLFTLLTLAAFQPGVFAKTQPAEAPTFGYAHDIGTDNEGNVYVLDLKKDGRRTICKYNSNGKPLTEVASEQNEEIRSFAIDKRDGTVYFALPHKIKRARPNGIFYTLEDFSVVNSPYNRVAVDSEGNVYANTVDSIIKFDHSGRYSWSVVMNPNARLLGVDSRKCVFYGVGAELWKAIPTGGDPSGDSWKLEYVSTNFQAEFDSMAFSGANDCLYFADRAGYIFRGSEPNHLTKQSNHYGDLRRIAVHGETLYIANGIDGVLKVNAITGDGYSSKLFSVSRNEPNYFVRTKNGDYYISCGGAIWQYDKNGNEIGEHKTGMTVSGVALHGDALLFNAMNSHNHCKLFWRRAHRPEVSAHVNNYKLGALTVGGDYAYIATGTEIKYADLSHQTLHVPSFSYKALGGEVGGLASDKKDEVFYVDREKNEVWRATNVFLPNEKILGDLKDPRAIALANRKLFVSNEGDRPHIGKYTAEGRHLSDFVASSMKNIRDLVVDGNDVIVLQKDGVWKYSNAFAR